MKKLSRYKPKLQEAANVLLEVFAASKLPSVKNDPAKETLTRELLQNQRRLVEFYLTKYEDEIGMLPPAPIEDREDDCGCDDQESVDIDQMNQVDQAIEVDIVPINNFQSYADALNANIDDDDFFM